MRCLVVGTGSIGLRHCRNLVALGHEVLAWDPDGERRRAAAAVGGVTAVPSLEDGLEAAPEAALICAPPAHHVPLARRALGAGAHLFVEKPIAHESRDVPELIVEAERRGRVLCVGYNLRFLPSLRRVRALLDAGSAGRVLAARAEFGSYLPDWRPGRDYRDNYAVHAALGGGILLDAIHELDYLGWLFGDASEVLCAAEHVSELAGDTEDWAELTLRFDSGVRAQVHLDYLQRVYRRGLQVIGDAATIAWDYAAHTVTVHRPGAPADAEDFRSADGEPDRMYRDELAHFARCAEGRDRPLVDGREALRSLRLVEAARASSRDGGWVKVP
jgi:predicted dehydrogenase